jgi:hypothetical protein
VVYLPALSVGRDTPLATINAKNIMSGKQKCRKSKMQKRLTLKIGNRPTKNRNGGTDGEERLLS